MMLILMTSVAMAQNPQTIRKTLGTANDTTLFGVKGIRTIKIENIGTDSVFTYIPDRDGNFSATNYIAIGKGDKTVIKYDGIKIINKGKSAGVNIIMYINDVDVIRKTSGLDTSKSYNFTSPITFNKLIANRILSNEIDSVHSTYWYNDSGRVIGYINSATSEVAFFDKMTVGEMSTTTTVASNYIWTNNLGTDTLYGNSPVIAKDTILPLNDLVNTLGNPAKRWGGIFTGHGYLDSLNSDKIVSKTLSGNIFFNVSKSDSTVKIGATADSMITISHGKFYTSNGTATRPSYSFTNYPNHGFTHEDPNYIGVSIGGTKFAFYSTTLSCLVAGGGYGFYNGQSLWDDGAGLLGIRNTWSNTPINFNIYDKYSTASSYRRLKVGWTLDSTAVIGIDTLGQYSNRPFRLQFRNGMYLVDTLKGNDITSGFLKIYSSNADQSKFLSYNTTGIGGNGTYLGLSASGAIFMSIGGSPIYLAQTTQFGVNTNNSSDLGRAAYRWKDAYLNGTLYSATASFSTLPTYADDAAAGTGGLTAGQLYKTSSGTVMIKL